MRGQLTRKPESRGSAYRDETSARSETITETRGILSIYVIIDTSLLIYGVTRDTVQRAARKNLEEEEEEEEEEDGGASQERKKQEGRGGPSLYGAGGRGAKEEEEEEARASIYRRARIQDVAGV